MAQVKFGRPQKNVTKARSGFYRFYASVGADVDLYADGPQSGTDVPCAEIHVLGAGNLVVRRPDGTSVTITGIPAGYVLPIEAEALIASGTTATNILVLW